MNGQRTCASCEVTLAPDATEDVCPQCLLEAGMQTTNTGSDHAREDVTLPPNTDGLEQPTLPASEAQQPTPANVGTEVRHFGDYELLEEIARGGMGVVYKARHQKLNRLSALKMILAGRFSSQEEVQRFQIEAEAAARLDHVGIVPIYEIGEHEGQHFFAMKFIEGGSLSERLEEYRTDVRSAVKILVKVARAVHHGHQRGVLHRDLKPANILIDDAGEPMVTDFGLAKDTAGDSGLTNTGAILGTPAYMPPEQASGTQAITTAADVYALGAILYELLSGQPPYRGASPFETVMKVLQEPVTPPRQLDQKIDRDLELTCLKCLERDPEERYASAAGLADDLESWLAGDPISARPRTLRSLATVWMRNNRRIVYLLFAMLLGTILAVPLLIGFVAEAGHVEVYSQLPDAPLPALYRYTKMLSPVAGFGGILALILYLLLGLLNAVVTRPASIRKALQLGILTALICAVFFSVLLGWVWLVGFTAKAASDRMSKSVGRLVWSPSPEVRQAGEQEVLKLAPGLDRIREEERADIFARKLFADLLAEGPRLLLGWAVLVLVGMAPIIYGTVAAHVLLARQLPLWLVTIRYVAALAAATVVCVLALFAIHTLLGISWRDKGERTIFEAFLGFVAAFVPAVITTYLVMRRWRRAPTPRGVS